MSESPQDLHRAAVTERLANARPRIDAPMQEILDAELLAGNEVRSVGFESRLRVALYFAQPAHDLYLRTHHLPGVFRDETHDPRGSLPVPSEERYLSESAVFIFPGLPPERARELLATAQRDGRLLPNTERLPLPDYTPTNRLPLPRRHQIALLLADLIEQELKRLGLYGTPVTLAPGQSKRPFAGDILSFDQWLQSVLLPRMRDIAATGGEFPPRSKLAAQAVREFDGRDDTFDLSQLLWQVDELCPAPPAPRQPRLWQSYVYIALVLGWTAASFWFTHLIVEKLDHNALPKVLITCSFNEVQPGPWHGLQITAWTKQVGDTLRGDTLTFSISPTPGEAGATSYKPRTVLVDYNSPTPRVTNESNAPAFPYAAAEFAHFVEDPAKPADAAKPNPADTNLSPAGTAAFTFLDAFRTGANRATLESLWQKICAAANARSSTLAYRDFPTYSSDAVRAGIWAAIFLPPTLLMMFFLYRRNYRRRIHADYVKPGGSR